MILALAGLALIIYAMIDLISVKVSDVRWGSKLPWAAIILLLPVVGAGTWVLFGRESTSAGPRTYGPDDDPDFLRGLGPSS